MAFEQKENSGALFKNNKDGNPNRPDMRGDINIEGRLYSLSAWTKPGKDGKDRWLSLSVTPKEARHGEAPAQQGRREAEEDTSLPF